MYLQVGQISPGSKVAPQPGILSRPYIVPLFRYVCVAYIKLEILKKFLVLIEIYSFGRTQIDSGWGNFCVNNFIGSKKFLIYRIFKCTTRYLNFQNSFFFMYYFLSNLTANIIFINKQQAKSSVYWNLGSQCSFLTCRILEICKTSYRIIFVRLNKINLRCYSYKFMFPTLDICNKEKKNP